jgi:hypothetical protein
MKRLLTVLIVVCFLAGCVPMVQKDAGVCPHEEVTVYGEYGTNITIPKGWLDDPDNYFTNEELEEQMKKLLEDMWQLEKDNDVYNF